MSMENTQHVSYQLKDGIATIQMDDGKNNLITPTMLDQLNAALDQAEQDNAIVILTGSREIFSAGFDLKILRTGVVNTFKMLIGGFKLSRRILAHPNPVIIACNGHALAMGVFIVLSGDYRIGVEGDFKLAANEVKIGLTMPYSAIEICRQRLRPASFDRTVLLSEYHDPQSALEAGFLDELVNKDQLESRAMEYASELLELDQAAHTHSKERMRSELIKSMDRAIRADQRDFVWQGLKRVTSR